jgi:hypothetical protein
MTTRTTPARSTTAKVLVPVVIGSAVAVVLGVYGGLHRPAGYSIDIAGFSSTQSVKSWLASAAALLGVVQLISAMVMYGRIPVRAPSWIGGLHRWSGRIAVLITVPVVVHCLYALGFQTAEPRVFVHSLLGCFFYGAFTAKMLLLSRKDVPGWALPAVGGALFTALVGLWFTSAFWFFTTVGVTL